LLEKGFPGAERKEEIKALNSDEVEESRGWVGVGKNKEHNVRKKNLATLLIEKEKFLSGKGGQGTWRKWTQRRKKGLKDANVQLSNVDSQRKNHGGAQCRTLG